MAPPEETKSGVKSQQDTLFPLPPVEVREPQVRQLPHPIWTENKARLVAQYIYLFEQITKHGTYIDGFAGPQQPDRPEMWAAKLVLDIEPKWLRHFYLFEKEKSGCNLLRDLKSSQPLNSNREIEVTRGDFNREIDKLLVSERIGPKEATFCLLDQRTFECHWATVEKLARYRQTGGIKFELFYFLAAWWYRRAVTALKRDPVLKAWWGRDDWPKLRELKLPAVREELTRRLKSELGYMSVKPWPILDRDGHNMYYMIHATDHPVAPSLMQRAYEEAVDPRETPEQFTLTLQDV